jgi:hypothetical protein
MEHFCLYNKRSFFQIFKKKTNKDLHYNTFVPDLHHFYKFNVNWFKNNKCIISFFNHKTYTDIYIIIFINDVKHIICAKNLSNDIYGKIKWNLFVINSIDVFVEKFLNESIIKSIHISKKSKPDEIFEYMKDVIHCIL